MFLLARLVPIKHCLKKSPGFKATVFESQQKHESLRRGGAVRKAGQKTAPAPEQGVVLDAAPLVYNFCPKQKLVR